ncbi:MAG: hypothetical protein MRY74_05300 [Neomegalonema sp.]|nr:hypothetical protein [Neomegalonema sp.]
MNFDFPLSAVDITMLGVINVGVFISAVLVLLMQPGFMLFEAGTVSRKNVLNNIFKNIVDLSVGGIVFWLIGWQTLSGQGPIIGYLQEFGLTREPPKAATLTAVDALLFLFNFGFVSASATICSGAVTGRISPYVYVVFAAVYVAVIYPVLGFIFWHPASALYGVFHDFAGAMIVHGAGAAAGLAGAILLRPRIGFNGYDPVGVGRETMFRLTVSHAPHNMPLAALGMFLLWLGWFGFNAGTLLAGGVEAAVGASFAVQEARIGELFSSFGQIAVNTAIAPCAAVVATVVVQSMLREPLNMMTLLNSVIAGLVGVTAGADIMPVAGAALVGVVAAIAYRVTARSLVRLSIDDPVSVVAAHGVAGVIAAVAAGLAKPDDTATWLSQLIFASAIFGGVFVVSLVAFKLADLLCRVVAMIFGAAPLNHIWSVGYMRVHHETEIVGLDEELHGQDGYNFRDRG